jgi:hypothetical protein
VAAEVGNIGRIRPLRIRGRFDQPLHCRVAYGAIYRQSARFSQLVVAELTKPASELALPRIHSASNTISGIITSQASRLSVWW